MTPIRRPHRHALLLEVAEAVREVNDGALLGALSLVGTETLAEMAAVLLHPAAGRPGPDPAEICPSASPRLRP